MHWACFRATRRPTTLLQGWARWAKEWSLGCVNSLPRPEGVRRRDSRNLRTTLLPIPAVVTQSRVTPLQNWGQQWFSERGVRKTERRAKLAEAVTWFNRRILPNRYEIIDHCDSGTIKVSRHAGIMGTTNTKLDYCGLSVCPVKIRIPAMLTIRNLDSQKNRNKNSGNSHKIP